jgi:sortase A
MVLWMGLTFSLLSVWMLLYSLVFSGVQESRSQALHYDKIRQTLADATAPLGGIIPAGKPVAVLTVSGAGLVDAVVLEGTNGLVMEEGPGHRRDSVLPGQAGVSVIYGRSVTFGAPFAEVPTLRKGQEILATTGQGTFRYLVDGVRRAGDPLPAALPSGGARLVLVTSEGQGWRAGWAPDTTVYVDATMVGETQPTPSGRLGAVPAAEKPMGRDTSTLVSLLLWLQLFLVASIALVWTWYRWGRWQTWVVGIPVLIAVLWGMSESALALLPNLM